jgi:predicted Ser/Thr protein kinase
MDSLIGKTIGQYQILEEIGRGGMGTVYKAYQPRLECYVALRVLSPQLGLDEAFLQRFYREARAAARLAHPNIIGIYDVGEADGAGYIAMEYVDGPSLADILRRKGPLDIGTAIEILSQIGNALDYAHSQGMVHRDVKPSNILIAVDRRAILTDFGITKAASLAVLTKTGIRVGTPEYMSPEQAKGLGVDHRSDIYSLGVVVYEMLSGRTPFQAESPLAVMYRVAHEPPPPIHQVRPDLPAEVERVLAKALEKEPGDRYGTAEAFVDALGRALAGEVVERIPMMRAPAPSVVSPIGRTKVMPGARVVPGAQPIPQARRKRVPVWIWAVGGLVVLALVVGLVMGVGGVEGVFTRTPTPSPTFPAMLMATLTHTQTRAPTRTPSPLPTSTPRPTFMPTSTRRPPTPTHTPTSVPTLEPTQPGPRPTQPPPTQPPPTDTPAPPTATPTRIP